MSYLGIIFVSSLLIAGAFGSVVDEAEGQSAQALARSGQPIPGQWIVVFNDQVQSAEEGLER